MLAVKNNEKGSILIVSLMTLLVLSFIGTTALTTSRTEVKIASNLNSKQDSFYSSDGGLELGVEILNDVVNDRQIPGAWSTMIPQGSSDNDFVEEVTILGTLETKTPDATTTIGNSTVDMDIDFVFNSVLSGSSTEFGSGYEGIGMGSQGGFANFYMLRSTASKTANNTRSVLRSGYRKTMGIGG